MVQRKPEIQVWYQWCQLLHICEVPSKRFVIYKDINHYKI